MAWDTLTNGELLSAAEMQGFDVMLTADQGIFYQQNNLLRTVALVVVSTNYRPALEQNVGLIRHAIKRSTKGSFEPVTIGQAR